MIAVLALIEQLLFATFGFSLESHFHNHSVQFPPGPLSILPKGMGKDAGLLHRAPQQSVLLLLGDGGQVSYGTSAS